jgi:hypothetical protein
MGANRVIWISAAAQIPMGAESDRRSGNISTSGVVQVLFVIMQVL